MIQGFSYDPICNPAFIFLKKKRYCRYINIYFEKKCRQLKRSPKAGPLVMIAMAFVFGGFFLLLAQLPIFSTEMSYLAYWVSRFSFLSP